MKTTNIKINEALIKNAMMERDTINTKIDELVAMRDEFDTNIKTITDMVTNANKFGITLSMSNIKTLLNTKTKKETYNNTEFVLDKKTSYGTFLRKGTEIRSVMGWCNVMGLNYKTVKTRLANGYSYADAFSSKKYYKSNSKAK